MFRNALIKKALVGCMLALLAMTSAQALADSPDLSLKGLDGKMHPLSEYIGKGKWVVFNVWGPKCPPCMEEMPELQNFHDMHHNTDAIVVGAALDFPSFGFAKPDEVKQFVEDNFITFTILLTDSEVTDKIGAGTLQGTPTTLLYNRSGKLVARQVGPVTQKMLEDFIRNYDARNSK
jgi:thiol-disulfide isomerase/thioredoxin